MQKTPQSNKLHKNRLITVPNFCLLMIAILTIMKIVPYGVYYNHTTSMPLGFYWVHKHKFTPKQNQLVLVCLTNKEYRELAISRQYLPTSNNCDGVEPMLKRIAGISGDALLATPLGITINGRLISNTRILNQDGLLRKMSSRLQVGIIPKGYYLVLGDSPMSFDSRYYGLVPESNIIATAYKL
ncbi:MAG: conjugative transfer signal peptidase TraF [Neisseriaceae bacterium]|nr:MAG: conjugative transfer signal peptidase TraF [Neisseriaceae bacterium]